MMKAILVDDEKHCTESLDILLKAYCPAVEVVGKYNRAEEALEAIGRNSFDVLFLDIEMPVYNGFELLNRVAKQNFDVVFTTAYDQFAVKAFKYSAFDYLLKPIDADELVKCVEKLSEKKSQSDVQSQLSFLRSILDRDRFQPQKIALPTTVGVEYVEIADIVRCESDSNYTRIFLNNQNPILICRTLKEVEELLENSNFARIHHSHLISLDHLRKYVRSDGGYVIMSDGSELTVSRSRKDVLNNLLKVRSFRN
ncbi:LytTR family DNA-binding domain-containing protein [Rhabdobacter roseus]|uniref:Two-component system LytT family response regulator n=1 Tax=Rhabdobacter roseus TaxID=1655419 RepID=A0A840TSL2_9BACT|nr:LytTR family DNA-binding domain-containing protein [Rhabdobacter roseus]MBB5284687.1 two-component system LytT family response regulator [Rhabdobacter roseus]